MSEREQINILAVDDDLDDLILLRHALENVEGFDYVITTVFTPEEALRELVNHQSSFDLCLMDLRLGLGKSGTDVIATCQELHIAVPFLILTGVKADRVEVAKSAALPLCLGFLSKDITISKSIEDRTHFDKTIRFAIQKFRQQKGVA